MILYEFKPNIKTIGYIKPCYSIEELAQEIGVYSATPQFIKKNCGKIANDILDIIPKTYYEEALNLGLYPNCDIRIHRLYPGDYPGYPGWHCDGEYRETYFSQPDLNRIKVSKHIIVTVSSNEYGISNCQFLDESFSFQSKEQNADFPLWQQIDSEIEKINSKKMLDTSDGNLYLFDSWTLHRTMPAKIRGWRLFFRMAMWHKPNLGNGGMISKQEQVYKLFGKNGW